MAQPRSHVRPVQAAADPGVDHRPLGEILVDLGKLDARDVGRVLRLQQRRPKRFGELAVKLGMVSAEDVFQALAIQFQYSCLRPGACDLSSELVSAYQPNSRSGEAIRDLRSQLLARWFDGTRRTLAITSCDAMDGRSHVAANLAVAFAQMGLRTLLIDADLRAPRQHRLFALGNREGLSSLLIGRGGAELFCQIPYFGSLNVLPAGPVPPNPLELFARNNFERLIVDSIRRFDVVLCDTSALARGADAQMVASTARGALLIARKDHSHAGAVRDAFERISATRAQVVGTALNHY